MEKTLVLFDIGATLLKLDFDAFYRAAAALSKDMTPEQVKEAHLASKLSERSMKGDVDADGWIRELRKIIKSKEEVNDNEIRDLFAYTFHKGTIKEMIELKERLYKSGCSVGIFSNAEEISYRIIKDRYPEILETFDPSSPIICSFRVGEVKPHPKGYKRVKGYKLVVFIDDKESYIKTGIDQFGWKGILFTPYIDKLEAIRAFEDNISMPESENYKIANSVEEVVEALRYFGVNV